MLIGSLLSEICCAFSRYERSKCFHKIKTDIYSYYLLFTKRTPFYKHILTHPVYSSSHTHCLNLYVACKVMTETQLQTKKSFLSHELFLYRPFFVLARKNEKKNQNTFFRSQHVTHTHTFSVINTEQNHISACHVTKETKKAHKTLIYMLRNMFSLLIHLLGLLNN